MPSDSNFGFSVLIAGLPVPEYHHEGKVYVESNLWTPVSYNQRVRELAYKEVGDKQLVLDCTLLGEALNTLVSPTSVCQLMFSSLTPQIEEQDWPVTP